MKTEIANSSVERGNVGNEKGFFIEATSEAFEILSSGLYKDQILAPIRELSTNAYDAHVLAGNPETPFEIHVPTRLSPNFGIRDFGPGLSDEDIDTVYRGYFKSTKNTSNDFVGCMGLGSKSPFAYVDSFSVISYQNGVAKTYTCFKNEENKPDIVLLGESQTTEPNGLFVTFPVKESDFYAFREACEKNFTYYTVKPKFVNVNIDVEDEPEYIIQNALFGVKKQNSYLSSVIMGNVAYPFTSKDFNAECSLTKEEEQLVKWGVNLFLPIGDVKPAASRECLSFNKRTMQNIKNALASVILTMKSEISNNFNSINSSWDVRIKCAELSSNVINKILNEDKHAVFEHEFKGSKISNLVDLKSITNKPSMVEMLTKESPTYYNRSKYTKTGSFYRRNIESFYVKQNLLFFVNDMNIGAYSAISRYIEDKDVQYVILLSNDKVKEFVDELEIPLTSVIYASTIPKPAKAPRPKNAQGKRIVRTTLQTFNNGFNNEDVDLDEDEGIYLECTRGNVTLTNGNTIQSSNLYNFMSNLSYLKFDQKIYFVRPSDLDKLRKRPDNWKDATPVIEQFLLNQYLVIDQRVFFNSVAGCNSTKSILEKLYSIKAWNIKNMPKEFEEIVSLAKKWEEIRFSSATSAFRKMEDYFPISDKTKSNPSIVSDIENKYNFVISKYSVLDILMNYMRDSCYYPASYKIALEKVQNYIEIVNSSNLTNNCVLLDSSNLLEEVEDTLVA